MVPLFCCFPFQLMEVGRLLEEALSLKVFVWSLVEWMERRP